MLHRLTRRITAHGGFTLIELIIVIGILGILTIGLLLTIDPLEHLARSRDANRRSLTVEYYNALQRYYSTNSQFPWGAEGIALPAEDSGLLNTLISAGELSQKYLSKVGVFPYTGITITTQSIAGGGKIWVCFDPESKSISREAGVKYSAPGSGTCDPATIATCFFCAE